MKLFPAIDLLGGQAVRLEEGKRDRVTVFHERPVELVAELARDGADRLHVVDLDGAFGEPRQLALVAAIIAASPIPVEVGGGIRDRAAVDAVLALGAAFVVLGTAAVRSPALVGEGFRAYPGQIGIAVDAGEGVGPPGVLSPPGVRGHGHRRGVHRLQRPDPADPGPGP